jgi:tetratricopeptide (TPR) repeat protein
MYLKVNNTQQVRTDNIRSWELEARNVKEAWMAQWCGICKERIDSRTAESLEKIAAIDPQKYIAYVCRGVAWYLQKSFEQSLIELEQAIALEPEVWHAYFWKGMVCAVLRRDEDAKMAIKQSLEKDMPPVLLAPLRWFEQD